MSAAYSWRGVSNDWVGRTIGFHVGAFIFRIRFFGGVPYCSYSNSISSGLFYLRSCARIPALNFCGHVHSPLIPKPGAYQTS